MLDCRAVTLRIGERKTWRTQSEFCTWQNSVTEQQPPKMYNSLPAQVRAKHCAKFGWLLLSDVAAVTKPRCKSRWNYLGCPKLTKQYQPLVGRSSPYCKDIWGRYWCLTSIFPIVNTCLSCEDIAWQSFAMVPRRRFLASCISSKRHAVHFTPALCGSMADIQSATAEIRRGKKEDEEKKKETTGQKYNGLPYSIGQP